MLRFILQNLIQKKNIGVGKFILVDKLPNQSLKSILFHKILQLFPVSDLTSINQTKF